MKGDACVSTRKRSLSTQSSTSRTTMLHGLETMTLKCIASSQQSSQRVWNRLLSFLVPPALLGSRCRLTSTDYRDNLVSSTILLWVKKNTRHADYVHHQGRASAHTVMVLGWLESRDRHDIQARSISACTIIRSKPSRY